MHRRFYTYTIYTSADSTGIQYFTSRKARQKLIGEGYDPACEGAIDLYIDERGRPAILGADKPPHGNIGLAAWEAEQDRIKAQCQFFGQPAEYWLKRADLTNQIRMLLKDTSRLAWAQFEAWLVTPNGAAYKALCKERHELDAQYGFPG